MEPLMDCYIGIDVSKATLDVTSLPDGESWTVTLGIIGWVAEPNGIRRRMLIAIADNARIVLLLVGERYIDCCDPPCFLSFLLLTT